MTTEEKIFQKKRFVPDKLGTYGFTETDRGYSLSADLLGGDFTAEITVGPDGSVRGRVIDRMNEEEYVQLRNPNYTGAYVNTVRDAYEKLLRDIAEKCCAVPGKMDERLIREVLDLADGIPYGKVATYGQIARIVGREKNARLIGKIMSMADRYGDHPCHRVVNHAGRTVPGWTEQRALLEAEGVRFRENGCVDLAEYRWER